MVQSRNIDVIGVILDVGPSSSINLRDGKVKEKRSITIGDETNVCIGVTLWGSVAEAHPYRVGQVIALKGCRVSEFNGKSLNASSHAEDIFMGLRHERAQELTRWTANSTINNLRSDMRSIGEPAVGEKNSKTPTFLIKQLQEHVENDSEVMRGKPLYANVHCDLTWVFVPENTDRQMFYQACESCKKKVMPDSAGFSCESCDRVFKKAVPTYNF